MLGDNSSGQLGIGTTRGPQRREGLDPAEDCPSDRRASVALRWVAAGRVMVTEPTIRRRPDLCSVVRTPLLGSSQHKAEKYISATESSQRPQPALAADPTDLQSAPPTGQSGDDRPSKSGFPGLGPA